MQCRICGSEDAKYRDRSRMALCNSCHKSTPAKAHYDEFIKVTGLPDNSTGREFYSDYRVSTFGSVKKYWESL